MSPTTRINAQAAAWIARLNADDRTAAVDTACREWLNADPQHRAAFEIANQMWEDASRLPVSLAARIGRPDLTPTAFAPLHAYPSATKKRLPALAIAASLILVVGAGALWFTQRPETLETRTGQQLTVPLEDGSRVILNTQTRLRIRFDPTRRAIDLEAGEALFDVAKDSRRPFVVRAGEQEITALGTQFIVRHDETQTAVTLVDGKVLVGSSTPPSLSARAQEDATMLEPGERVTFIERTHAASIDRPAMETVSAWRKGEIVFENTPLTTAIAEMNRYSTRKLLLGDDSIAQLPVSGLFRSGDTENFALALAIMHPLNAVEHGNRIEIRAR